MTKLAANAKIAPTPKAFVPRAFQILCESMDDALHALPPDLPQAQVREIVARRIISLAEHGETDPQRLRDGAIAHVNSMLRYRGADAH